MLIFVFIIYVTMCFDQSDRLLMDYMNVYHRYELFDMTWIHNSKYNNVNILLNFRVCNV
jgi:hypothetical protein